MADKYLLLISKYEPDGKRVRVEPKTWKHGNRKVQSLPRNHVSECIKLERHGVEFIGVAIPTWLAKDRGFLQKDENNKFEYRVQGIYKKRA